MSTFGEGVKTIFLAGVGAVAVTAEKSKELVDELVKKGELTMEQGKVLNEELKHDIRSKVDAAVNARRQEKKPTAGEVIDSLDSMSEDEMKAVKAKLKEMEQDGETADGQESGEDGSAG